MRRKPARIVEARVADAEHRVVTVSSSGAADAALHCTRPCPDCPWRKDAAIGAFPAEAYRHSARTAYDMAESTFGCHMTSAEYPATCAGFLLSGARHNLAIRLQAAMGRIDLSQVTSPVPLYANYREMAEANGVPPRRPGTKTLPR